MMTDKEEAAYEQGERTALAAVIQHCCKHLGYKSEEGSRAAWIVERESAIAMLRRVCEAHGDNDWPDNGNLADIIEKHLGRYLED